MCSTFSVCSLRCSVIMMTMTSCNLPSASFSASSSTVRFHPLGVLSNCITLPVSLLYANARPDPKQTHSPCCVMGLTARSSHLCLSTFNGHWFAFCIRLANSRVRQRSFRVSMTPVSSCCWTPGQRHGPARCRVASKRDLSAPLV